MLCQVPSTSSSDFRIHLQLTHIRSTVTMIRRGSQKWCHLLMSQGRSRAILGSWLYQGEAWGRSCPPSYSLVREPLAPTYRIVTNSIPPPIYNTHSFPHLTLALSHSNLQLTCKGLSSETLSNLPKVSQQNDGRIRPRNRVTQACGVTIGSHCLPPLCLELRDHKLG